MQERRPGVGFFRTAFFLPGAVGFAAAALLFYGMLNNDFGPIDPILRTLGPIDEPVKWIGTPNMALFSTITLVLWRFAGFNMLILLTGLQAIPVEVYEAARSDGAGRWQIFTRITLPLLRPTLALMLILSVTGSLLAFDQFFIFTNGGPDNSTVSIVMVIYRDAFFRFDLGGAAALSVVLLAGLVGLNILHDARALSGLRTRTPRCSGAGRAVPVPAAVERLRLAGEAGRNYLEDGRVRRGRRHLRDQQRAGLGDDRRRHARSRRSAATPSPASTSPARTCCSSPRWRSSWCRTRPS